MNLNEVEKHVKFDLIFQLLIYIGIGLCLLLSLIVILATPAKALTETNISNGTKAGSHCSTHPNGSICTSQIYSSGSGNPCGNGDAYCVTYNSTPVSNLVMSMDFYVNTSLGPDTKNTITFTSTYFSPGNYNCMSSHYSCTATRVSSTKINVNFNSTNAAVIDAEFFITKANGSAINDSSHDFRIMNVVLYENPQDSGGGGSGGGTTFDDSGIINNANQNTTDIMNNANQNAQETQNAIFSSASNIINVLQYACKNLFNIEDLHPQGSNSITDPNPSSFMLNLSNSENQGFTTSLIPVVRQGTYSFKTGWSTGLNYAFMVLKIEGFDSLKRPLNFSIYDQRVESNQNVVINMPVGVDYIRVSYLVAGGPYNGQIQFGEPIIVAGDTPIMYCKYGSSDGNRLEEIGAVLGGLNDKQQESNDIAQDQYNYLTDDTDPTVNSSDINNVIGEVQVQDPLNYLLTLPLNLLTKLNTLISSGTCSRASFGQLYGTELYLPCINFENYLGSSLWTTIDTIVGIGLLVVILKKFYDTISNILSLGKEEEIRKGMELPTPMEFLAQILGGGK